MPTCAECSELLLEYLYGLLDEPEAQELRDHVTVCSHCQEALAEAKNQQNLLARAARKFRDVPAFQPPADDLAPALANGKDQAPTHATPRPTTLALPVRRQKPWRLWLAAGTAAAVLLACGTVVAIYQWGLSAHQQALADARKQIELIDDRLAGWAENAAKERTALAAKLEAKFLQVEVLGPATVQPGVGNAYRLTTQTPLGQPAPAEVAVKLLAKEPGQENEQIQFRQTYQSGGELQFLIPDKLPLQSGAAQRLHIEVSNGVAKEIIEEPLAAAMPTYVSHVSLSKTTCHPGETVFFRSVTLERFALTPIDRPVALSFTLYRVTGAIPEPVKSLQTTTGVGGVAGGDFALPTDLVPGQYLFALTEIPATKEQPFTLRAAVRHLSIESARQTLQAADAEEKDKAKQTVPLGRAGLKAEFFPEGGELIAGTSNRVYLRLQASKALPADLVGIVEDSKNQEVASVKLELEGSPRTLVLGCFSFTPKADEAYRFHLSAARKVVDRFDLPSVLSSGVALTVPHAVIAAGQPLQAKIYNPQRQSLLVLVNCRGRTVDQRLIENAGTLTDVILEPQQGKHGVMRVTVYTADGGNWRPAAERLIYRQSAQYLRLSAAFDRSDSKGYKPGDSVNLTIESRNEARALSPSWLFAAVVDESALRPHDRHETGLPAYFLLTSSLEAPEELEDANILLADSPSAAQALDLILGTQGWRRFWQPSAEMPFLAAAAEKKSQSSELALFSAGNRLGNVFDQYTRAVQMEQAVLAEDRGSQRVDLQDERVQAAAQTIAAAASLAAYQERSLTWFRQGLGVLLALLVVVGAALLFLGLAMAFWARSSPRLWLACSSAVLVLALVLFAGTTPLRTPEDAPAAPTLLGWLAPREPQVPAGIAGLGKTRKKEALAREEVAMVTSKFYTVAQRDAAATDKELEKAASDAKNRLAAGANFSALGFADPLSKSATAGKGGKGSGGFGGAGKAGAGGFGGAAKPPLPLQQKDKQAAGNTQSQQNEFNQALPGMPSNSQQNFDKKILADVAAPRQYAYANSQPGGISTGLLLWQPLLTAADGTARVGFDLPANITTYRILIQGHTADGRLGVYHGKLEAK
jgi:hypothetical protein